MARFMRTDLGGSKLRPPVVVNQPAPFIAEPIRVYSDALERSRKHPERRAQSHLSPPAVVGAGIAWHGPGVYPTYPFVGRGARGTRWHLAPPTVVNQPAIYFGPRVYLNVMLPERRGATVTRRSPDYEIKPPVVTATNGPSQYVLTYSRRGRPKSFLRPPTDTIGLEDQGRVRVELAPQRRGTPKPHLSPPAVVAQPVADVFYGPSVTLVRITPPKVHPTYVYPAVIAITEAWGYLAVQLVVRPRPKTLSRLSPPAVLVAAAQIYYGPRVTLARIRPRRVESFLRPPQILQTNLPTGTTLAPQRRGKPRSRLAPPVVVFLAVEIYGPETSLAPQRRGVPHSFLRPPVDTVGLEDQGRVATHLAPQRRGRPTYFLAPPTDTVGLEDQGRVSVHLINQHRTVARYHLQPPTVVTPEGVVFYGPAVSLAPGRRPVTKPRLEPPTVIDTRTYYGPEVTLARNKPRPTTTFLRPFTERAFEISLGPELHLAPSRFPKPKSRLRPPAVVAPVVSYGPEVRLTYSRRGRPKSVLRPPRVVSAPLAIFFGPSTSLAYSRRGRPKSVIRPPRVVFPFFARRLDVTFAYQTRGRPKSRLRPPAILRERGRVETTFAYQRRGRPIYELRPPRVVREAVEIFGPEVTFAAKIAPRSTYFKLSAPAVVRVLVAGELRVYLTRNKTKPTTTFLRPPTRVRTHLEFGEVRTYLTRIKHPPVLSILFPPTVIGDNERYFGPKVTLVRIKHPPVQHFLRLTLVAFRRPSGDVCGFDIAGSFVCELQLPASAVSGSDSSIQAVTGASSAGSTVTGSDSDGGSVSGSDRKAT